MIEEEVESQKPVTEDRLTPKHSWGLGSIAEGADAIELVVYGGGAAVVVGYLLWAFARAIWEVGSTGVRFSLLTLIALGVGIIVNDIRQKRLSLLSKVLIGIWVVVLILIGLADLFSTIR